jgi:hypothetical protein
VLRPEKADLGWELGALRWWHASVIREPTVYEAPVVTTKSGCHNGLKGEDMPAQNIGTSFPDTPIRPLFDSQVAPVLAANGGDVRRFTRELQPEMREMMIAGEPVDLTAGDAVRLEER